MISPFDNTMWPSSNLAPTAANTDTRTTIVVYVRRIVDDGTRGLDDFEDAIDRRLYARQLRAKLVAEPFRVGHRDIKPANVSRPPVLLVRSRGQAPRRAA